MTTLYLRTKKLAKHAIDGPILLPRSKILSYASIISLSIILSFTIFISITPYTRRVTLPGVTNIDAGVFYIQSKHQGVITKIFVREGDQVESGSPLFIISSSEFLLDESKGTTAESLLLLELDKKIKLNQEHAVANTSATKNAKVKLRERQESVQAQIESTFLELDIQNLSIRRSRENLGKLKTLADQSFVSTTALKNSEDELAIQTSRKISLDRKIQELTSQVNSLELDISELDLRLKTQEHHQKISASEIHSEKIKILSRHESLVTSPVRGKISSIAVNPGETTGNKTLTVITPQDSTVTAQLLVPSRSIGFIRTGQHARIRYRAFPHQKYGMFDGIITDVSAVPLREQDIFETTQMGNEPKFRIKISLSNQILAINNKMIPLTPGMALDADISTETRKISEWILEPIQIIGKHF